MKRLYHFEEGVDDVDEDKSSQNQSVDSFNREGFDDKENPDSIKQDGPSLGKDSRKPSLITNVIEQFMRVLG
jgi:hypothetical protein